MQNPTQKGHVVSMDKTLSDSEDERTQEARGLICMIPETRYSELTSWERQTVEDVKEGKAATKVRVRELRAVVKRLQSA